MCIRDRPRTRSTAQACGNTPADSTENSATQTNPLNERATYAGMLSQFLPTSPFHSRRKTAVAMGNPNSHYNQPQAKDKRVTQGHNFEALFGAELGHDTSKSRFHPNRIHRSSKPSREDKSDKRSNSSKGVGWLGGAPLHTALRTQSDPEK